MAAKNLKSPSNNILKMNAEVDSAVHAPKRKSKVVSKATEYFKQVLFALIESQTPFSALQLPAFQLVFAKAQPGFNPTASVLFHLALDLFDQYQAYFKEYFTSHPDIVFNLVCHQWHLPHEEVSLVFVKAFYINDKYNLCEILLGEASGGDSDLAGLLSNCYLIPNLGSRILHITIDFTLGDKTISILNHITGNKNFVAQRVIPCISLTVNGILSKGLTGIVHTLQLPQIIATPVTSDPQEAISLLMLDFLGATFYKMLDIDATELHCEQGQCWAHATKKCSTCFEILKSESLHTFRSPVLAIVSTFLTYQSQLQELASKQKMTISDAEWDLIEFAHRILAVFHQILIASSTNSALRDPVVHMLLKWAKILFAHCKQLAANFPTLCGVDILEPMSQMIDKLEHRHARWELQFGLAMAGYLHPNTKRYLSQGHLSRINTHVQKVDHAQQPVTKRANLNIDILDDQILNLFDCSGNTSPECYLYDTSARSEVRAEKNAPYLSAESGPHLLEFWRKYHRKYPRLAILAKEHLSIQVNCGAAFASAKLLDVKGFDAGEYGTVRGLYPLYFLQQLVESYHLQEFDPWSPDANIEKVSRRTATALPLNHYPLMPSTADSSSNDRSPERSS